MPLTRDEIRSLEVAAEFAQPGMWSAISSEMYRLQKHWRGSLRYRLGFCAECNAERAQDSIHCPRCAKKKRTYARQWALQRIADGRCVRCGSEHHTGKQKCEACLAKTRAEDRARYAARKESRAKSRNKTQTGDRASRQGGS